MTNRMKQLTRANNTNPILVWALFAILCFCGILFVQVSTLLAASPPPIITYQGKLLNNNSAVSTTVSMGFLIFDALTNGNLER